MKRIFQSLVCGLLLFVCGVAAQATPITIQSQQIPDFRFTGANLTLRIFLNDKGFITSDGFPKQPGSPANGRWYKEVACSLAGSTLTIASFTIDSTIDGLDTNTATYSAWFYSGNTQLQAYAGFDRFRVPNVIASSSGCAPSGTCATWADLRSYNFARVLVMDNSTYVKSEIDAKIAVAGGVPATSPFILKTAVPGLSGAQVLASLGSGILKNTTGTGVLSLAVANTDYLTPTGSGAGLTNLNAGNLSTGTIPDARFPSVLPAISGLNLTNLNAGNLASGTIPDARFPSVLPAISALNLTNLNASNLGSGTVPDARLSANVSLLGSSIDLSGSEATGILAAGRFPSLTGDVTTSAGSLATTLATNSVTDAKLRQSTGLSLIGRSANSTGNVADILAGSDFQVLRRSGANIGFGALDLSQSAAVGSSVLSIPNGGTGSSTQNFVDLLNNQSVNGNKTFTGITKLGTVATVNEAYWQSTGSSYLMLGMADSDNANPSISPNPSFVLQTTRSGGTQGIGLIASGVIATNKGKSDLYGFYPLVKYTADMTNYPAGAYNQLAGRSYTIGSPINLPLNDVNNDGQPDVSVNIYGHWIQGRRTVGNIRAVGGQIDGDNTGPDASIFTGSLNTVYNIATNQTSTAHGTAIIYSQGFSATNSYAG